MVEIVHPQNYSFNADLLHLQYLLSHDTQNRNISNYRTGVELRNLAASFGLSTQFQDQLLGYELIGVSDPSNRGVGMIALQHTNGEVIFSLNGADRTWWPGDRKLSFGSETLTYGYWKTGLDTLSSFIDNVRVTVTADGSPFSFRLNGTSAGGQLAYVYTLRARGTSEWQQINGTYLFGAAPLDRAGTDPYGVFSRFGRRWYEQQGGVVHFMLSDANGNADPVAGAAHVADGPFGLPPQIRLQPIMEGLVWLTDHAGRTGQALHYAPAYSEGMLTNPTVSFNTWDNPNGNMSGSGSVSGLRVNPDGSTSVVGLSRNPTANGTALRFEDSTLGGTGEDDTVTTIYVTANGKLSELEMTEREITRKLNLEQLEQLQKQLQPVADAANNMLDNQAEGGPAADVGSSLPGPGFVMLPDGSIRISVTSSLSNLFLPQIDPVTGALLPTSLRRIRTIFGVNGEDIVDSQNRHVDLVVVDGVVVKSMASDGWGENGAGVTVETLYSNGEPVSTNIKINNNPIGIEFSDAGAVLGQQLGYLLAGDNKLVGIVTSAALQTVGDNLGDVLDGLIGRQSIDSASKDAFKTFGPEFLANLKAAGIGAVSSFLTAELVNAIGLSGFEAELANTVAGTVINTVLTNAVNGASLFHGLSPASIGTAIGSFLGNKLANEVITFDTIGGQIGSAVGSTLAVLAVSAALGGPPGLIIAAAAAFIGNIVGGLIGSLFGGTPRSGADVLFDPATGTFGVANIYARKGGSKDAAQGMAAAVAGTFNAVIAATGGRLMNPALVQTGNYGMRKSDFVYRPTSTRDKDAITQRFSGKDGAERLIGYGVYQGLTDPDFKIVGGDIYVKRAIYNTFELDGMDPRDFDPTVILGNIATAQRYETYLANSTTINALITAEPDSVFTAEWAITFARAVELGLTRRHESDWYGGFNQVLGEAGTNAANVTFKFSYDPFSDKLSRLIGVGDFIRGESIDVAGQTSIEGSEFDDIITLSPTSLAGVSGAVNDRLKVNGTAHGAEAVDIGVAATIEAGAGDDQVQASDRGDNVFGGDGNDTLYGGRLDDWLMGDEGNDTIFAGSSSGGAGGDGNYLEGGGGDDMLVGREGSDWLEGGDGTDTIEGGRGDDFLAGGAGKGDKLRGGLGDDQYIFRTGDTDGSALEADADLVRDESGFTMQQLVDKVSPIAIDVGTTLGEALFRRFGLGSWTGNAVATDTQTVSGNEVQAGGDDTLVLGPGITIGDISILPNAAKTDLVITIVATGEKIVLQDWFNPLNKIENLQFADGQKLRIADFDTFTLGTTGDDFVWGTSANDFVHAGSGNDVIYLLFGNDFGNGGDGNDFVSGDPGNDIVVGMDGDDIALGGLGSDNVSGGRGDDEARGGGGNDVVSGGEGSDFVVGGAGDDVFKFNRGDGADTIVDELSNEWETMWVSGPGLQGDYHFGTGAESDHIYDGAVKVFDGQNWLVRVEYDVASGTLYRHKPADGATIAADSGTDTIEFGVGIDAEDLQFRMVGNDLVIGVDSFGGNGRFEGLTDRITLKEWASGGAAKNIEKLGFFASGTIDASRLTLSGGTDGSDAIVAGAGASWIAAGGGDDEVTGGGINDLIVGHSGADWLKGGAGADILIGGLGDDRLDGGANGLFHDSANGDSLGNQVAGEAGVARGDTLVGGAGYDVASYGSAAGGITASLRDASANLGDAEGDAYSDVEGLEGSAFADTLIGDQGDNELAGGKGDDTLEGNVGEDVYVFGRGDGADVVYDQFTEVTETIVDASGALGGDYVDRVERVARSGNSYQFVHRIENQATGEIVYERQFVSSEIDPTAPERAGDGWVLNEDGSEQFDVDGPQVTRAAPEQPAGDDTLFIDDVAARKGSGATGIQTVGLNNLGFEFIGADLVISIDGSTDTITLKNFRNAGAATFDAARGIETLALADGEQVSLKGLAFDASGGLLATGTDGDDLLVDMADGDGHSLVGQAGNDTLSGRGGIDTLDGGAGDDLLAGGEGVDTLIGGSGVDTVTWYGSASAVSASLATHNSSEGGVAADSLDGVENLIGSDHADTLEGNDEANSLQGNSGDDTLSGEAGRDALLGDAGNDTLDGGSGDDSLDGGEGGDTLTGGADNDVLIGGAGNDVIRGDHDSSDNSGASDAGQFNRIANGDFEDLGDPAGDGAASSADLPGWSMLAARPFAVPLASANRRLALDGGSANLSVIQSIEGIGAGQTLTLSFNAETSAGETGAFEVWWNSEKLATISAGGDFSYVVTGAASGKNSVRFVGIGAADGVGATIDNVRLLGSGGGFDTLVGGEGDDTLYGGAGGDTLAGGEGADILHGGDGKDALHGGRGTDQLFGGAGADSYFIAGDGGLDTITTGGGQDSIVFGETEEGSGDTLTAEQIRFAQSDRDLVITVAETGSVVTVKNWFVAATGTAPSAEAARRIVVAGKALTQADVALLLAEMNRIGSGAPDAAYQAVFDAVWQPLESFTDDYVVTGTSGNDTLSSGDLFGGGRFEGLAGNDTIDGSSADDVIVGGAGSDEIRAGSGDDQLNYAAEAGFDTVDGGDGADRIVAEATNAVIGLESMTGVEAIDGNGNANVQIQLAVGSTLDLSGVDVAGVARIVGSAGEEQITGSAGNDVIDGGTGADSLAGGTGDDIYHVDNVADAVAEAAAAGTDSVVTTLTGYALGANVENLTYSGTAAFTGTGNALANALTGGSGADTLDGGAGDDTLTGGAGNDTYLVDSAGDDVVEAAGGGTDEVRTGLAAYTLAAEVENLTATSDVAHSFTGNAAGNRVTGGAGADTLLLQQGGDDSAIGGDGNDTVYLGAAMTSADAVDGGAGTDELVLQGNYATALTLGGGIAGIETLTLLAADDARFGNAGTGSYSYNLVTVNANVAANQTLTVSGAQLRAGENFTFNGSAELDGKFIVSAGNGANVLTGGSQADSFVFAAGVSFDAADSVTGGAGSDWLALYGSRTIAFGATQVQGIEGIATMSGRDNGGTVDHHYNLTANNGNVAAGQLLTIHGGSLKSSESLTFDGSAELDGQFYIIGGAGADTLIGGSGIDTMLAGAGNDIVDGGIGADTMTGAAGDDAYQVDNAGDVITEIAGEGTDTVKTILASYTLGATLENLTFTGSGAFTGTGNASVNAIAGGAGNDTLDGAAGSDTMTGGAGDDTYLVDVAGDLTVEAAGAGSDEVKTGLASYTLQANVEKLTATTNAAHNFTGNTLGNVITGHDGNDTLGGGDGDDTLTGGLGVDTLDGGAGIDTVNGGDGNDLLKGSAGADAYDGGLGVDTLDFSAATALVKLNLSNAVSNGINPYSGLTGDAAGDTYVAGSIENVTGSAYGDTIVTGAGGNLILAGDGIDTVYSGDDADTVQAGAGADSVYGGLGNDNITGEAGADMLKGEDGIDTVSGGLDNDTVYGGMGNDTLRGDDGDDMLVGEGDTDTLYGGLGNDAIVGNALSGTYTTDNLEDQLYGEGGNDTFYLFADLRDRVYGGDGIDTITFVNVPSTAVTADLADAAKVADVENLVGGGGGDTLSGSALANMIDGAAGNDVIDGRAGIDTLYGAAGNDTILGGTEADSLYGGDGVDNLDGGAGGDQLLGDAGDDVLKGGADSDMLDGGLGGDTLDGGAGADIFNDTGGAGNGIDTVTYAGSAANPTPVNSAAVGAVSVPGLTVAARTISLNGVRVDHAANTAFGADAQGDTFAGIEKMIGSAFADQIRGHPACALVEGGAGDDLLYGSANADILNGGGDNDIIYAEAGVDNLWGGEGSDRLFGGDDGDFLYGEGGADILDAGNEGDVLDGGTGNDQLAGGNGADTYIFKRGGGVDEVYNYDDDSARDAIEFYYNAGNPSQSIANTDLWFTKSGSDLIVRVIGTTDQMILKSWFTNNVAGDWTADDNFRVDIYMAGSATVPAGVYADWQVNLPTLLSLMKDVTVPTSVASMDATLKGKIDSAWQNNTPPAIASVAGNAVQSSEDVPVAGTPIYLKFRLSDAQTVTPSQLTLSSYSVSGGVFAPLTAADITTDGTDPWVRVVKLTPLANMHGQVTLTLKAADSYLEMFQPFTYNFKVLARADAVQVSAAVTANTNAGSMVMLPGSLAGGALVKITDTNSEIFNSVVVSGIPVGAVLSDGVNSFTATAGVTSVNIAGWNTQTISNLRITPPAGSSVDFTLTVTASSKENVPAGDIDPGYGVGATATTTIKVNVNTVPTNVTLGYATPLFAENAGNVLVGTLSAVDPGDQDAGDTPGIYAYSIVGAAAQQIFQIVGNQLWVKAGQSLNYEAGSYALSVQVTDSTVPGAPLVATYVVPVLPANVNEAPVAVGESIAGPNEDQSGFAIAASTLLANDTDVDVGDTRTLSAVAATSSRGAGVSLSGTTITYSQGSLFQYLAAGQTTTDTFTYTVRDAGGLTATATATLTITGLNDAPVAVADSIAGPNEDQASFAIGTSTLLANDGDVDSGDTRSVSAVAAGSSRGASVSLSGTTITYSQGSLFQYLAAGQTTTDSFTYTTRDALGATSTSTVTLTVTGLNDAPVAVADSIAGPNEDQASFAIATSTLLANDGDVDSGDTRSVSAVAATSSRGASVSLSGTTITYSQGSLFQYLAAGQTTTDSFSYTTRDAAGATSTSTVTLTIAGVNDAPVAVSDSIAGPNEDQASFAIATSTLLANDGDVDSGDTRSVSSVAATSSRGASVSLSGGTITYSQGSLFQYLAAGQTTTDSFSYTIQDAYGATSTATATMTISGVNDAPVITGISWLPSFAGGVVSENVPLNAPLAVISVSDPDGAQGGHSLSVSDSAVKAVWNASAGRYELQINNGFDYESAALLNGGPTGKYANVTVTASDGAASSSAGATVNVGNIVLQVWTPGQYSPTLAPGYQSESYSTEIYEGELGYGMGGGGWGGSGQTFLNEWILRHVASGRVIAYYSEYHQWPNTTSQRPESSATYAEGYTVSGTWPNFSVWSSDENNTNEVWGGYGGGYPIGLDLGGDGLELIDSHESGVAIDHDLDGIKDRTGWVGADDALLVLDRDKSGAIEDGSEISFVGDKPGAKTDLEGLAGFDSNGDNRLDGRDARFGEFQVWQDANQDGVSQAGELRTLSEAGIVYLSLAGTPTGQSVDRSSRNVVLATADFGLADGTRRTLSDLVLRYQGQPVGAAAPPAANGTTLPIVFDLNADGVDLIHLNASHVSFDHGADGTPDRTGWVGPSDGLLVLDRDHDGTIGDSSEISFVGDKAGAATDLEGLAGFDGNSDGIFDARDARFGEFQVWRDANQDGVSQSSELRTLAAAGIVSIDLAGQPTGQVRTSESDNVIVNMTRFTRADGSFGQAGDVALAFERAPAATPTTPATPTPPATPRPPALAFAARSYQAKSKRYEVTAQGGSLYLMDKKAKGEIDPRAALIGPSSLLTFKNRTFGLFDPIVLDLDGDGVELRSIKKAKARFDMDGDGALDDAGWTGKGDGFLVIDRDGDGRISGPAELSFLGEGTGATGSLDGLGRLDANRDGKLDAGDARFGELKVWQDLDGDGATDAGELRTLADHGISSIALAARPTSQTAKVGQNLISATATFTRADGSTGTLADAALAFRPGHGAPPALSEAEQALVDRHLEALREGAGDFALLRRDDRAGLVLPDGADPFERFARRGAAPAAASGEAAAPAAPMAASAAAADPRLALIAQDMAAFGARRGAEARDRLDRAAPRFDYHAG